MITSLSKIMFFLVLIDWLILARRVKTYDNHLFILKVNSIAFSLEFILVVTDRLLVDKTNKKKTTIRRLMVGSFMLRLSWLFRWAYFSNPRFCHWLGGSCFHIHLFFIKYIYPYSFVYSQKVSRLFPFYVLFSCRVFKCCRPWFLLTVHWHVPKFYS